MADISLDLSATSGTFQDFLVVDGNLLMTNDLNSGGSDPVVQDCIQTLKWIAGEWFLDIQGGIPYFQEIFIKNPDQDKINAIFLSAIQNVPGVIAVTFAQFTPKPASRTIQAQFSIQKTTGIVSYSGLVNF